VPLAPPLVAVIEAGLATMEKIGAVPVIASVTVAVLVTPPPVPVTVSVYVPTAAVAPTAKLRAELPFPGAAIEVGVNVGVTFAGVPLTDSATALLNPFSAEVLIVTEPLLPCATDTEFGEAEMLKLGAGAVIVSVAVVVWVTPPPVPVTMSVYVPTAALAPTAKLIVELPVPGAAIDVGLNVGVTFAGRPLIDKATALLNPFRAEVLIVTEPLFPCCTETEFGEAEMLKLGDDCDVALASVESALSPPASGFAL
jgi:hypothetical protein